MLQELQAKTKPKDKFPIKLLRYLVIELIYGGKLTDKLDHNIMRSIVKNFVHNRELFSIERMG